MNSQLDAFETRLLTELRGQVNDRTAETDAQGPQRHFHRSRLALLAAVGFVVVGAILVAPGVSTDPAYSVGEGNAGEVQVEINRPEDAAGLEQALADRGVNADITYLPRLQICAPGRYVTVDREPSGIEASIGEQHISVTLPPSTVRDGETFVLAWSVVPLAAEDMAEIENKIGGRATSGFASTVEFEVATGEVAPCRPIAAD